MSKNAMTLKRAAFLIGLRHPSLSRWRAYLRSLAMVCTQRKEAYQLELGARRPLRELIILPRKVAADEPQRVFEIPSGGDPRVSLGAEPTDNSWKYFLSPEIVGSELFREILVCYPRAGLLLTFPSTFHLDESLEFSRNIIRE